ncbi:MAG TPA: permease [Gemmatales bacterium]|nr:permease [Gemmatales bacterium]HMP58927.1 permease [Gemmatales bacterium]
MTAISNVDRFLVIFPSIIYEALPFIILGALISGTLEELLPQQWFARLIPKRRWLAILGSSFLGLIFPMCECGIVVVMRRLLSKGLPLGCAVAYMLAAPIVNPIVILSTYAAFSGEQRIDGITSEQMTTLRVGGAVLVSFLVGLLVNWMAHRYGTANLVLPIRGVGRYHEASDDAVVADSPPPPPAPGPKKPIKQRLWNISEVTLHDFVDITCYLCIGAMLAAALQTFRLLELAPGLVANPVISILVMMAVSLVLCLCSEADAFVAANLPIPVEMALSSKFAFLLVGPMMDIKLYFMYTRVFRQRLIWTIIGSVVLLCFLLAVAVHYLNQAATPGAP